MPKGSDGSSTAVYRNEAKMNLFFFFFFFFFIFQVGQHAGNRMRSWAALLDIIENEGSYL